MGRPLGCTVIGRQKDGIEYRSCHIHIYFYISLFLLLNARRQMLAERRSTPKVYQTLGPGMNLINSLKHLTDPSRNNFTGVNASVIWTIFSSQVPAQPGIVTDCSNLSNI